MKQRNWKRLACLLLALLLLGSMTACGGNASQKMTGATQTEEGYTQLDILANINMDTLIQDGNCVYFDVYVSPDVTIHFGGVGVTVEEDAITINPHGYLFSMDYMGQMIGLDIAGPASDCGFDYGMVYANSSSVTALNQLHAALYAHTSVVDSHVGMTECSGGFFGLSLVPTDNQTVQLRRMVLTYDSSAPQTLYCDIASEDELERLTMYEIDWTSVLGGTYADSRDFFTMAEEKMAEAGSIESDIIAGIDHSSIEINDQATHFTSIMSNGEAIRFEATDITIDENGITMAPGATITSLDAVGKIYLYTIDCANRSCNMDSCVVEAGYGYTYSASKTSVETVQEIHTYLSTGIRIAELSAENRMSMAALQPNFVYCSAPYGNEHDVVLTSLTIGYNPEEKVTGIVAAQLNSDFTPAYLAGDLYNLVLEEAATSWDGSLEFYLVLQPDTEYSNLGNTAMSIWFVPGRFVEMGDLKNENGEVVNKNTTRIGIGYTLDLTIGDYTVTLDLVVKERYAGATTLKELRPYCVLDGLGSVNTLVVPVGWPDQMENVNDDTIDLFRSYLGRVEDASGEVTDYSDPDNSFYSLSQYFDTASYGKFTITSYITDWFIMDENFSDMETIAVDKTYGDKVVRWIKQTYPDLDWSRFDQDGDGYIDSLVLINAGNLHSDGYSVQSYGGACQRTESYCADYSGTQDDPLSNCYVSINWNYFSSANANVLIHEYSHLMGLIDYYDVTYAGGNAVGGYDMQSANVGDWNSYSKLAVGWMDPQIVTGLASGESVELTIGSSALTDDVIVIPAAGTDYDGPFGEYIMIDLFSDDGVNTYDAAEWGLSGVSGVRISHVDANMETWQEEKAIGAYSDELTTYTIGTPHRANAYNKAGLYHVEVIQASGINTFTDLEQDYTDFSADDLFQAGDTFSLSQHGEFFVNGLMDDGSKFGYTITIVSVGTDAEGNPSATIRITAD